MQKKMLIEKNDLDLQCLSGIASFIWI